MKIRAVPVLIAFVAAFALAAPAHAAPQATPAVLVPAGISYTTSDGTRFWLSVYGRGFRGNLRFSWSHMWYIRKNMESSTAIATSACMAAPRIYKAPCGTVVLMHHQVIRAKVYRVMNNRKCLKLTWGVLPNSPLYGAGWYEVTCTR